MPRHSKIGSRNWHFIFEISFQANAAWLKCKIMRVSRQRHLGKAIAALFTELKYIAKVIWDYGTHCYAWNEDTRGTCLHVGIDSASQAFNIQATKRHISVDTNAWYYIKCPPEKHWLLVIFHLFHRHVKSISTIRTSYRAASRKQDSHMDR